MNKDYIAAQHKLMKALEFLYEQQEDCLIFSYYGVEYNIEINLDGFHVTPILAAPKHDR